MEIQIFKERKKRLVDFVNEILSTNSSSLVDTKSMEKLLEILDSYTFENRKEKKGTLTRTIIDSLELNYSLGEKFIEFDTSIK